MKKIKSYCEVKKAEKASKTPKKKKKGTPKNVGLYKVEMSVPVSFLAYGSEDEFKKFDYNGFDDITEAFYSSMYETLKNPKNAKLTKITKTSQINSDKNLANVDAEVNNIPITDSGAEKIIELIKETDVESMKRRFDPLDYVTPEDIWDYDSGLDIEAIVCLNKMC